MDERDYKAMNKPNNKIVCDTHLNIYKDDGDTRFALLPILRENRLIDLMYNTKNNYKNAEPLELEHEISFSLLDCKMIASYFNNIINKFENENRTR